MSPSCWGRIGPVPSPPSPLPLRLHPRRWRPTPSLAAPARRARARRCWTASTNGRRKSSARGDRWIVSAGRSTPAHGRGIARSWTCCGPRSSASSGARWVRKAAASAPPGSGSSRDERSGVARSDPRSLWAPPGRAGLPHRRFRAALVRRLRDRIRGLARALPRAGHDRSRRARPRAAVGVRIPRFRSRSAAVARGQKPGRGSAGRHAPIAVGAAARVEPFARARHPRPARSAARGAFDALGLLLSGLSLALLAAAAGGAVAERAHWTVDGRAGAARLALGAAAAILVALPLWRLLDPALFYDRTRSVGAGFAAALFVAAFAGAMSGAAARGLFAPAAQAGCPSALAGRPALLSAARLSALDATQWLVPLVPALAAAAVFACAKADQDPSIQGISSGLGSLIRAAMREVSVGERLSSAALVGGALVVLWALGHRFVAEVRASLGSVGSAR